MRVRLTAVSMALLLPLALAACGGSSSNSIREEAIADLTSQLTEAGESQAVIDCMTAVINGLSDDDVTALDDDTASAEVKEKFMTDSVACATSISGSQDPLADPQEVEWQQLWDSSSSPFQQAQCQRWRADPQGYSLTAPPAGRFSPALVDIMMARNC